MDGVTVGHPRCNVMHCVQPLTSPRDRFCQVHAHLSKVCAINGCEQACTDGKRTCSAPRHRQFELRQRERGQAIFKLRRRMEGRHIREALRQQEDSPPGDGQEGDVLDEGDVATILDDPHSSADHAAPSGTSSPSLPLTVPPSSDPVPTPTLHARPVASSLPGHSACDATHVPVLSTTSQGSSEVPNPTDPHSPPQSPRNTTPPVQPPLTPPPPRPDSNPVETSQEPPLTWNGVRAWTHNEQLMVRCCGVILSRATFYTAESPSNCLVRLTQVLHWWLRPS